MEILHRLRRSARPLRKGPWPRPLRAGTGPCSWSSRAARPPGALLPACRRIAGRSPWKPSRRAALVNCSWQV